MNSREAPGSAQGFIDPQKIDWNLLKSFYLVADLGSLTRAATALGASQPTLSRQIAELEAMVGASLFERVARGLSLTTAGKALLEPASRMLAAAQAASVAATAQQQASGTVRITASEIMSAYVLPAIVAGLRSAHPHIQIELVASNELDNLLAREADIAIRMVRPEQAGLITRKIAEYPLGFYAHRDYVARRGLPASLDQWRNHDWVGLDHSNQLIEGFRQAGFSVDKGFFAFRCDNQVVGWQAVLAGVGIGITLQRVAQQYPHLTQVLEQQPLPQLPVWLTAHRELRDAPRIRVVFDFLAQALAMPSGRQ